MSQTFPVYSVKAQAQGFQCDAAAFADIATLVHVLGAILQGISVSAHEGEGLCIKVKCPSGTRQGLELQICQDLVAVQFLHAHSCFLATSFEIHVLAVLFGAIKQCCSDAVDKFSLESASPSVAQLIRQAQTFADRVLARAKDFAVACSDPRAQVVVSMFKTLRDQGATDTDVHSLCETFRIDVEVDGKDIFVEAMRAFYASALTVDQLRRAKDLYCTLV